MLFQKIPNEKVDAKAIKVKITIPTNVYFVAGVRNFTLELAQSVAGFDKQWSFRFQTIVDELVNNAIRYGSEDGDEIELEFKIYKHEAMSVKVSDCGKGKPKHAIHQMKEILHETKIASHHHHLYLDGRGFEIINNWSDEVEISESKMGGVSVLVKKFYKQEETPTHHENHQHSHSHNHSHEIKKHKFV